MYIFHLRELNAQNTVLYCMYINIVQAEIISCVGGGSSVEKNEWCFLKAWFLLHMHKLFKPMDIC